MQRVARDRTTIVIAHRLQTARAADRIVVLEHGRVPRSARTTSCSRATAATRGCGGPSRRSAPPESGVEPAVDEVARDRQVRRDPRRLRGCRPAACLVSVQSRAWRDLLAGEPAGLGHLDRVERASTGRRRAARRSRASATPGTATAGRRRSGRRGPRRRPPRTPRGRPPPRATPPARRIRPASRTGPSPHCVAAAEQRAVGAVVDQHDHGRVGAREVLAAVGGQVRVQPAWVSTVGAPHRGQCVCRWCHCSSATALTTSAGVEVVGARRRTRAASRQLVASSGSTVTAKYGTSSATPRKRRGAPSGDVGRARGSTARPSAVDRRRRLRRDRSTTRARCPRRGEPRVVVAVQRRAVVARTATAEPAAAVRARSPSRPRAERGRAGRRSSPASPTTTDVNRGRREELGRRRADLVDVGRRAAAPGARRSSRARGRTPTAPTSVDASPAWVAVDSASVPIAYCRTESTSAAVTGSEAIRPSS